MTCGPLTHNSPSWPTCNLFPFSSIIFTSVDCNGIPIEPLYESSILLIVTTGDVSVRPYPCVILVPVIFFHFFAVSLRTAIPPPTVTLKLLKLIFLNLLLVINRLNNVFTPVKTVNFFFSKTFRNDFKSLGLAIRTFSDPIFKNVKQFTVKENIWYKGNAVIIISFPSVICGLIQLCTCWMFDSRFLCVNNAAFDLPVVPPVYWSNAVSSKSVWTSV